MFWIGSIPFIGTSQFLANRRLVVLILKVKLISRSDRLYEAPLTKNSNRNWSIWVVRRFHTPDMQA